MNLQEARKRLPELSGLSDESALNVIHQAYYPQWDKAKLAEKLGYTPPPAPVPERGMLRGMADIGLSVGQGAVGAVKSLTDLGGADNAVSQGLGSMSEYLQDQKSDQSKATMANSQARIKEAEATGDWKDQAAAYMNMLWDQPGEMIAQGVGSFAPMLVTGPLAASAKLAGAAKAAGMSKEAFLATEAGQKAIKAAADVAFKTNMGVGAAQGVGTVKGAQYEQTFNAAKAQGKTDEEATALATEAQAYGGAGTAQQLLGGALGAGAAATGPIERVIAGKAGQAGQGLMARTFQGAVTESVPEALQGGQERYAGNTAAIDAGVLGEDARWRGVVGQGLMEGAVGGLLGGGVGAVNRSAPELEVDPAKAAGDAVRANKVPESGPMSRAANMSVEVSAQMAEKAMSEMEQQIQKDLHGLRDFAGRTPNVVESAPAMPGQAGATTDQASAEFVDSPFSDRLLTLQEQLADPANRERVRARWGDQGLSDILYYAGTSNRTGIPKRTQENMLTMAERLLSESLLTPIQPTTELGGMVRDPMTLGNEAPAAQGPAMIGMNQTPSGRFTVDSQGQAAPETTTQRSDAQRRAQDIASMGQAETGKRSAPEPVLGSRLSSTPMADMLGGTTDPVAGILSNRRQAIQDVPSGMAERSRTDGKPLTLPASDPVRDYVDGMRKVNTPAAKFYVSEFDAGRITPADVQQRMVVERGKTPDERLADAAAHAPKSTTQPGDLLNPKGEPFKTLMSARLAAKKTPGDVIEVVGGYSVRPKTEQASAQPASPVPAGKPQVDQGAAQAPVKKEAQPQAMRIVVRRDITGDEFEVQGGGVNGGWEKQTTFRTADAANDFLKSLGHDVDAVETLVSEWSPKLKRFSQPKRQESTTPAQAQPVAAAVEGQPEQAQPLSPRDSRKLQEAHKALGYGVTRPQVQRMRDRVAAEVETGTTNNGGVVVALKPAAIKERREQLQRLDADLALFGHAPTAQTMQQPTQQQQAQPRTKAQPLLTDDEAAMLGDFERMYQADVKGEIKTRMGLMPARQDEATAPAEKRKPSELLAVIKRAGGIKATNAGDLIGGSAMDANRILPGLFTKGGMNLDLLVPFLKERGYLTQADEDSIKDNGGVNKLAEILQAELSGARAQTVDSTAGFESDADNAMRSQLDEKAFALGLPMNVTNEMSTERLNGVINRIERKLGKPVNADFATRKMSRTEAMAERQAILMADRVERARAQYDADIQAFAEANDGVQDAVLDVFTDENGDVVIVNERDADAELAARDLNGTWSDQNGQETTTAQDSRSGTDTREAGAPVARGSDQGAQNNQANRTEAGAGQEALTSYTPAEVTARQDAAAQAEATAKRAEDAAARAEAAAKQASEIARRSVAAADTFELGQSAEDNLSGQEGLKFSRTSDNKAAHAALAKIMEKGVTSPDDLRDLLRVPGYSKWAKSTIARDVAGAAALRRELQDAFPGSDWKAPKLIDQGIITIYPDWVGLASQSLDKLTKLADKYDTPIGVRGGAATKQLVSRLDGFGFELYSGLQERADRMPNVMFGMIRPAGGITATTPLFSKSTADTTGPTTEAAQEIVDGITARWKNAPDVVVLSSMQDDKAPAAVREYDLKQRSQGAAGEPEGFWYKGKAYIVASALNKPADVARVLFHEALGHYGLRGVFGDQMKPILQQIAGLRRGEVKAKAEQYGLDLTKESDRLQAAEEVLAEMAQTRPELGYVKRAIAVIRAWLRKHIPGFRNMVLTDAEIISQYLMPARNFVVNGGPNGGSGGGVRFQRGTTEPMPETKAPGPQGDAQQGAVQGNAVIEAVKKRTVIRDEAGKPLRLYHGSEQLFDEFDIEEDQRGVGGIWLTDSKNYAYDMSRGGWDSRKRGAGGQIVHAYLDVVNPLEFDVLAEGKKVADDIGADQPSDSLEAQELLSGSDGWDYFVSGLVSDAKRAGHDALVIKNFNDARMVDSTAYVVFDQNKIAVEKIELNEQSTPTSQGVSFSRTSNKEDPNSNGASGSTSPTGAPTAFSVKGATADQLAHYRGMGMQVLGRRQIVDLYGDMLPELKQYDALVQRMDSDKNESGAEADKLVGDWAKLDEKGLFGPGKHPGMERKLAELMHDSTLAQMDPDKPLQRGDDAAKHRELVAKFEALSPKAQAVYREARDMYANHFKKVQQAIQERIQRSSMDESSKAKMIAKMDADLFNKLKGVYFPLARFGKYVVVAKDAEGQVVSVSRAETLAEANKMRREVVRNAAKGVTVSRVYKDAEYNATRDAVGKGFVADLMTMLQGQGVGEDVLDSVGQLYLASMPDLSWAKHGIHRKGTPGFSQDARRAFAQNMFHGARHLAKLRYSDQLADKLMDMEERVKDQRDEEGFDPIKAQQVVDEMNARHDELMNPKTSSLSTALTSIGFVWFLGISPASALVNLSQTALVAYPVMAAKWGFQKAGTALLSASAEVVRAGNDLSKVLKGDELAAFQKAVDDGTIDVTQAHDLAGVAQGEDERVAMAMRPVMRAASFMFHHAEKFNRQATFIAAYRLAKENGADAEMAFEQAKKATYDGHFDYSASNRPRLMQGNWQKVLFLFKQYGQNMVYTLTRQAYLSMKGMTPQQRTEARKQLGGLLAMHAMAAGALGLPLVGVLLSAASMLGSDDDEPWDAEVAMKNMMADAMGPKAAEVMAHGLSRLTPWDLSGRVALNKLILPDIQEGLEGQPLWEKMVTAAAGPVTGIGQGIFKGMAEMGQGQYRRGLESMLPVALKNPVKAMRFGEEGVVDKTGVVIKDEVGMAGLLGQASGFRPSEVALATEGRTAIFQADKALIDRRSNILRMYAQARMSGDAEGVKDAMAMVQSFNAKNPTRRIAMRNLIQSVQGRNRRIEQAEQGIYLPKTRRDAMDAGRFALAE